MIRWIFATDRLFDASDAALSVSLGTACELHPAGLEPLAQRPRPQDLDEQGGDRPELVLIAAKA